MKTILLLLITSTVMVFQSCAQNNSSSHSHTDNAVYEFQKTDAYWKESLTPEVYNVLREKGTEPAFSGVLNDNKQKGTYYCAGCTNPLFSSKTKFDSGTGWPSFYTEVGDTNVVEIPDDSYGWSRTEVVCGKCGGHLGHVFDDGPQPTGLRYCINSASLTFEENK